MKSAVTAGWIRDVRVLTGCQQGRYQAATRQVGGLFLDFSSCRRVEIFADLQFYDPQFFREILLRIEVKR